MHCFSMNLLGFALNDIGGGEQESLQVQIKRDNAYGGLVTFIFSHTIF